MSKIWGPGQGPGFTNNTSFSGLYPGYPANSEHNWQVIDIKNEGSINGFATFKMNPNTLDYFGDNLSFTLYYDNTTTDNSAFVLIASGTLAEFYNKTIQLGSLNSRQTASVKLVWTVSPNADNNMQNKSVVIDAVFGLNQIANQPLQ